MNVLRTVLALASLTALLSVACGGGGSDGPPNLRKIPTATAPATLPPPTIVSGEGQPAARPGGEDTYVVEPGDSLSAIALRLGVDLDELISLNDLPDPSRLEVGQVIKIPAPPAPADGAGPEPAVEPTPRPETPPPPTGDMETYEVQPGDNASAIAEQFGVTLQELADANGATIDELRSLEVGQILNIPPRSIPEEPPPEEPTEEPTAGEPDSAG